MGLRKIQQDIRDIERAIVRTQKPDELELLNNRLSELKEEKQAHERRGLYANN
jgi:hypothetical protein